jgi:hypothetical protein
MSAFVQKRDVFRACIMFLYGIHSRSTVVLLFLSVYTGNYRIVFGSTRVLLQLQKGIRYSIYHTTAPH